MSSDSRKELDARRDRLPDKFKALLEQRLQGGSTGAPKTSIPQRDPSQPLVLSFQQESLWFLEQYTGGHGAYNIPILLRLRGDLDVLRLRESLETTVSRHESLRTRFRSEDGVPVPVVERDARLIWSDEDATGFQHGEVQERVAATASQPFSLAEGPLIRATLYRLGPDAHLFCIVVHHIIFDGWSIEILLNELSANYESSSVPQLPLQYTDYAIWQRSQLEDHAVEDSLNYWKHLLRGPLPVLELVTDRPRPPRQTFRGRQANRTIDQRVGERIRKFGHDRSATLYVTMLSAWAALLHRYTGQEDIITGTGVAGRTHTELEGLLGYFVNTLALRIDLSDEPGFETLLGRVKKLMLDVSEHQHVPFEQVVAATHPDRDPSHSPLYQVMFVFHGAQRGGIKLSEVDGRVEHIHNGGAQFDLTLAVTDSAEGLLVTVDYNIDLFEPSTADRILEHYERILVSALVQPNEPIGLLPLMSQSERRLVLEEWNATSTPYPSDQSIGAIFERQAESTPEAIALESGNRQWTYGELERVSKVAAKRLQLAGVSTESIVGLYTDRSPESIIATLAIVRAGGAYLPLDLAYPHARVQHVLHAASPTVLIVDGELARELVVEGIPVMELSALFSDDNEIGDSRSISGGADPTSLAYVMYTSGTTGNPKGVCVEHRNIVRLVADTDYVLLGEDETILQHAPQAFDAATFEIWGALLTGAKLVVAPPGPLGLDELKDAVSRYGITTLWLPAGLFQTLVDADATAFRGVRQLLTGGDVVSRDHVAKVLDVCPDCTVINGYGPTEGTTFTCCHRMIHGDTIEGSVPIGKPIANTRAYILDAHKNATPVGVPGDLYAAGEGVARGYLNEPELTAQVFVDDPFRSGGRMYRTGDRARWRSDGTVEFLGRQDGQTKVRGFRVELGEIETVLRAHPGVDQAAVIAAASDKRADKQLVAYVVLRGDEGAFDAAVLKRFVREQLPEYMVPSLFVRLKELPLTPNGKLDRRALPSPEQEVPAGSRSTQTEPRTDAERQIAAVWRDILSAEVIGIDDNFFDLGGHSLLAARVIAAVNASFGITIPLRALFETQTVRGLAVVVAAAMRTGDSSSTETETGPRDPCLVALQSDGLKRPFFCATGAGAATGYYSPLASYFKGDRPFWGLQDPDLDVSYESYPTVEDLASRYITAIRTVQPSGPYILGGWSFGGMVAIEMAQQLHQLGERVAFLGIIDLALPGSAAASRTAVQRFCHPFLAFVRWCRLLVTMRRTVWGYALDSMSVALTALAGRRDPALNHLRVKDYVQWVRHDLSTQHELELAGIANPEAQYRRLTLIHEPFVWHVFKTLRARTRALADYVVQRYEGRITLLRSSDRESDEANLSYGWDRIAEHGVDVRLVRGSHSALLREPWVKALAQELLQCLDALE